MMPTSRRKQSTAAAAGAFYEKAAAKAHQIWQGGKQKIEGVDSMPSDST
jgi:hypothetical protein